MVIQFPEKNRMKKSSDLEERFVFWFCFASCVFDGLFRIGVDNKNKVIGYMSFSSFFFQHQC